MRNENLKIRIPCVDLKVKLKNLALLLLVAQTVGAVCVLRASRVLAPPNFPPYRSTTAVVLIEALKLVMAALLVFWDNSLNFRASWDSTKDAFLQDRRDTLEIFIPAALYSIQNNLLFTAISNMSAAYFQVTYQLKTLVTAALSMTVLKTKLTLTQWISLSVLTLGVCLLQLPSSSNPTFSQRPVKGISLIGLYAVLASCLTSGFAGVYLEKILKKDRTRKISVWMRNLQLAFFGCIMCTIMCFLNDYQAISRYGFFSGYNLLTWMAVFLQSVVGIIVATVLKYADNISKCFANAISIVISCIVSYYLFDDYLFTVEFMFGTTLVILSTVTYAASSEKSRKPANVYASLPGFHYTRKILDP